MAQHLLCREPISAEMEIFSAVPRRLLKVTDPSVTPAATRSSKPFLRI